MHRYKIPYKKDSTRSYFIKYFERISIKYDPNFIIEFPVTDEYQNYNPEVDGTPGKGTSKGSVDQDLLAKEAALTTGIKSKKPATNKAEDKGPISIKNEDLETIRIFEGGPTTQEALMQVKKEEEEEASAHDILSSTSAFPLLKIQEPSSQGAREIIDLTHNTASNNSRPMALEPSLISGEENIGVGQPPAV